MKKYTIKFWETEEERENGLSEIYGSDFENLDEAIKEAKKIMKNNNFASIEVLDNNEEESKVYYFATQDEEEYFLDEEDMEI